jgi:inosine-uridine nucleoside N-ribohydrolase
MRTGKFLLTALLVSVPLPAVAETTKVFIDQDTSGPGGTDSISIAMLLKAPNIEVVGIGVVAGDAWLDQALYHTLKIAEVSGKPNVPIAAGAAEPLLQTGESMKLRHALWGPKPGDGWYGNWGNRVAPSGTIPPAPGGPPTGKPVEKHAAELLIEMARKYPGELVLYTAGPMTNVALAVKLAPDIVSKIKKVYTMGGAIHVNEKFNFWWDAEAAGIHTRTDWRERELTPIDVCHKTHIRQELIDAVAKADTPLARYVKEAYAGGDEDLFNFMWDELAAAAIIDPTIVTESEELYVDVDWSWGPNYGKTVWWRKDQGGPSWAKKTWRVQTDVDVAKFEKLYLELMTRP